MMPVINVFDYQDFESKEWNLKQEEIHIWNLDVTRNVPDTALLTGEELQTYRRISNETRKTVYELGHSALHRLLGAYGKTEPEGISLSVDSCGKPLLQSPDSLRSLRFNLSHSGSQIVIAISLGYEVGIDIEQKKAVRHPHKLLQHICRSEELRTYQKAPLHQQEDLFYRIWTGKEAVLKGIGRGFYQPGDSFSISCKKGIHPLPVNSKDARFYGWYTCEIPSVTGYICSLSYRAVRNSESDIPLIP